MTLRPLYRARLLHLPLSLLVFYLLLPQRAQETFSTLCGRVTMMRRLPPDCALLVFLGCCFVVCELSRVFAKEPNQTQGDKLRINLDSSRLYGRISHVAEIAMCYCGSAGRAAHS